MKEGTKEANSRLRSKNEEFARCHSAGIRGSGQKTLRQSAEDARAELEPRFAQRSPPGISTISAVEAVRLLGVKPRLLSHPTKNVTTVPINTHQVQAT